MPLHHRIALFLFLLLPFAAPAQDYIFNFKDVPDIAVHSDELYIYRIPIDSLQQFKKQMAERKMNPDVYWMRDPVYRLSLLDTVKRPANESIANNVVATVMYRFTSSGKTIPGYYFAIWADRDKIIGTVLHKVGFYSMISNFGEMRMLEVTDTLGQAFEHANVKRNGKAVSYNPLYKGYLINVSESEKNQISIEANNDVQHQHINRTPIVQNGSNDYHYERTVVKKHSEFKGYLVTNKPKYLPGDTIKFKAWLEYTDHKPVTEPLTIVLERYYDKKFVIFQKLEATEPGLYFNEFIIGDSIQVGSEFRIRATGTKSGAEIVQSLVVEDYLLDEIKLNVKTEQERPYQWGDSIKMYGYAFNSNNLPVFDGKFTLTVTGDFRGPIPNFKANYFIPDTLFSTSMPVSANGETPIIIPTSLFPKLPLSLKCFVSLVNANFEKKDTTIYFYLTPDGAYLNAVQTGDSLTVELFQNKIAVPGKGTCIISRFGESKTVPVTYPFRYKLDEWDIQFQFSHDSISTLFPYYVGSASLEASTDFVKDTAYIYFRNPQKVKYKFAFYEQDKYKGTGIISSDTLLKFYSPKNKTISLVGTYRWHTELVEKTFKIYKREKDLQIAVHKKDFVYPGQKDTISLDLSDKNNKKIPRTNVTVLAFNGNFKEDFTPDINQDQFFSPGYQSRYYENTDEERVFQYNEERTELPFSKSWLSKCAADTMFFYRNLASPDKGIAVLRFPAPENSLAQVSFYIKEENGFVFPSVIFINNRPVFYSEANTVNPDGFLVQGNDANNTVRLRTARAEYTFSNITFEAAKKNVFFINAGAQSFIYQNNFVKYYAKKSGFPIMDGVDGAKHSRVDTFELWEEDQLVPHFFQYKQSQSYFNEPILIHQYPFTFALNKPQAISGRNRFMTERNRYIDETAFLVGPLHMDKPLCIYQNNTNKICLEPELHQAYSILPGMTRLDKISVYSYFNEARLYEHYQFPNLTYRLPKPKKWADIIKPIDTVNTSEEVVTSYNIYKKRAERFKDDGLVAVRFVNQKGLRYYILYNEADTGKIYVFSNLYENNFQVVQSGQYEFLGIDQEDRMYEKQNITIRKGGLNVIGIDSNSSKKFNLHTPPAWLKNYVTLNKAKIYKTVLSTGETISSSSPYGTGEIYGTVSDNSGPFPGVTVKVIQGGVLKGGTMADDDGNYSIKPLQFGSYDVEFSAAGYVKQRVNSVFINGANNVRLDNKMIEDGRNLAEVSVVTFKKPIVDNTSREGGTLEQDVSLSRSMTVNAYQSRSASYSIGGNRSDGTIYGVDGQYVSALPSYSGDISVFASGVPAKLGDASGGVKEKRNRPQNILLESKAQSFISEFLNNQTAASGLRKDFRDWAIWEPDLWTNDEGKASFNVRYPDNLTSWKTYFLAMNKKGYALRIMNITRAFKPLSASLSAPRFLRYGDRVEVVGKVANYTQKAFSLQSSFSKDNQNLKHDSFEVNNTKVERLFVDAPAENKYDTSETSLSYQITAGSGFSDGEERVLPVYPVGAVETHGEFVKMYHDTTFESRPKPQDGYFAQKATLYIDGGMLDVMLREIEHLKEYPHGCVEQMTTKLISIYYEEEIKKMIQDAKPNNTKVKLELIKKIIAAQNSDGSFGWWSGNKGDVRVTNYVANALKNVNADMTLSGVIRQALEFLHNSLPQMNLNDQIASLHTLARTNYAADYPLYMRKFDTLRLSNYDRFALMEIKKWRNISYRKDLDTMMKYAQQEKKGTFWKSAPYDWYRDDLATTILAYKILKNDSVYKTASSEIMDYFLFKRKGGYYANTASGGLILQTILPELLGNGKVPAAKNRISNVLVKGSVQDSITMFPKTIQTNAADMNFKISKTGISPAFASVVYEYFNLNPKVQDSGFKVSTYFITAKDDTVKNLKQGENVKLRTHVTVKKNSEYVMIEVPFPAGCVPVQTRSSYHYREASRETFKDRMFIFAGYLSAGNYTFDIDLECRFKGSFSMNPARASLMYFPEEYGNTALKKVTIE